MTLYKPTFESVRWVAANMRAADQEEILPLWFHPTPDAMANLVMAHSKYTWLAATAAAPVAVFGMIEQRPKAWMAFAFGTDDFGKVAGEITKFLVRKVRPHLFRDLGAVRVEAHSHGNHKEAHTWLKFLGAKGEPDPEYGPNGETYIRFVMRRSDFDVTEAQRPSTIVVSGGESPLGGKPDFAHPAGSLATPPRHVLQHP